MAAVPNVSFISVEEYLRTTSDYEPECEYIDGVLEPKAMPDAKHGRFESLLTHFLVSQEAACGFCVINNVHVHVQANRYRIPDISVLATRPETRLIENPPLFTIEIVSENEAWPTLRRKVRDHHEMGVRTIIVADPGLCEVFVAQEDGLLRQIAPPLVVSLDVPGAGQLQIDFDGLFAQVG